MSCYLPLSVHQYFDGRTGKLRTDFHTDTKNAQLPCGRCLGCRLTKAKEWSIRCWHEVQMHEKSCFVTFTYNDKNLPPFGNLDKTHFPKFIRSLRKRTGLPIRYYMCGEYGDDKNRPHYHAILFGYQFPDAKFRKLRKGNRVYTSEFLDEIWGRGTCELGSATYQSAGYVARYIIKKQRSCDDDQIRYIIYNKLTGEFRGVRQFEYTQMSLKPGIGETWYRKFKSDLFAHDFAVTPDGRKAPVPSYYRRLLQREDPDLFAEIRLLRIEKAKVNPDNSPERLATISECQKSRQSRMTRNLDE